MSRVKPPQTGRTPATLLFVGERPSQRAVQLGVTWRDGALAACTLFDALRSAGYDPGEHCFCNLYRSPERGAATDMTNERQAIQAIRRAARSGLTIVGMGRLVQRVLEREGVPHLRLIHPAARGAIRGRRQYRQHVREVLPVAKWRTHTGETEGVENSKRDERTGSWC